MHRVTRRGRAATAAIGHSRGPRRARPAPSALLRPVAEARAAALVLTSRLPRPPLDLSSDVSADLVFIIFFPSHNFFCAKIFAQVILSIPIFYNLRFVRSRCVVLVQMPLDQWRRGGGGGSHYCSSDIIHTADMSCVRCLHTYTHCLVRLDVYRLRPLPEPLCSFGTVNFFFFGGGGTHQIPLQTNSR